MTDLVTLTPTDGAILGMLGGFAVLGVAVFLAMLIRIVFNLVRDR